MSAVEYSYAVLCIFLFITLGSIKSVNLDSQIYHLQIIRWQSEYGLVPGIANLLPRFGHGSNWFDLISFFHLPVKNENFAYVNISFVAWFFIWLLFKCKYHFLQAANPRNRLFALYYFSFFIFLMLDWQLARDAANSTNYDFQVTSFILMIISYFMEDLFIEKTQKPFSPILVLFGFAAISFKFSGIFLLLLIGYYLIMHSKRSRWLWAVAGGMLIAWPILVRNYVSTGYPLFPYPLTVLSPDWKVPQALANGYYKFMLDYNRFFNYWMLIGTIPDAPLNWVRWWFKGILIQHKIIFILALSSALLLFIKPFKELDFRRLRYFIGILLLMISGWFFSAPDPARFGYSFLLPAAFLVISILFSRFFNLRIYNLVLAFSIVGVAWYTYDRGKILIQSPGAFIYPMVTEKPPYKTVLKNGIEIHVPDIINDGWDHRCFNTLLPCLPGDNPYIEPRGKSVKEGFRMATPDSLFVKNYTY